MWYCVPAVFGVLADRYGFKRMFLASCLVIDPDHPSERAHLEQLAAVLELPEGLAQQLQWQAQHAMEKAA